MSVSGPSRCTINNVTFLKSDHQIDVIKWEQCVRNIVYREPNLRTDVDTTCDQARWTPATDFSEVFRYRDMRGEGCVTMQDVWHVVEEEANKPWQYGSGKPLFR